MAKNKTLRNSDINKSLKITVIDNKKKVDYKGILVSLHGYGNGVPYPAVYLFGNKGDDKLSLINLIDFKIDNIQPTRLPAVYRTEAQYYLKNFKDNETKYNKRVKTSTKLLAKFNSDENKLNEIAKKIKNKKGLSTQDKINEFFSKYFPEIKIVSETEDYDEYDMEEYNISDIEETRHLSIHINDSANSSWVIAKYIDLADFTFQENQFQTIQLVYPTFSSRDGMILGTIIREIAN